MDVSYHIDRCTIDERSDPVRVELYVLWKIGLEQILTTYSVLASDLDISFNSTVQSARLSPLHPECHGSTPTDAFIQMSSLLPRSKDNLCGIREMGRRERESWVSVASQFSEEEILVRTYERPI